MEGAIHETIRAGYRHFDTAKIYGSEETLGRELQKAGFLANNSLLLKKYGPLASAMK
ncbi:aldo/keto reductase [Paenibacillus chitinolyticus]|uniref:aldo/keto reductase n=1 Tax=Paenibacillus chitinolyticus TaxID=79263 RepID=UPI003CFEFCD3